MKDVFHTVGYTCCGLAHSGQPLPLDEFFFQQFDLLHILEVSHHSHLTPLLVKQSGREQNGNGLAILGECLRFVVDQAAGATVFGAIGQFLDPSGFTLRIEPGDAHTSKRLLRGIAVDVLSAFIENYDVSLPVIGDNPIHRGLDEIVFKLIALYQLSFKPFDLAHVLEVPHRSHFMPLLVKQSGREQNGNRLAILSEHLHFVVD